MLNGHEIRASVEESERLILELAPGHVTREQLAQWVALRLVKVSGPR